MTKRKTGFTFKIMCMQNHSTGAIGITIAVVANSVVKSGIAVYSGGLKFGRLISSILLGATVAGLGVLLVV